ncbi:cell division protein ZapE [Suttonella ornithocola]|uniref:AFG1-like ATPase n=1 Tax=Suttonella ornithocola TaxID=279832 RepID=A0A380MP50_9GAMM|nr:cell division protein ZapE [Suttonella ornithocola]SUO93663.1 AFG1-like ATPase [Suttonella ornithocola]
MTQLADIYRQKVAEKGYSEDAAQLAVIAEMQRIADALEKRDAVIPEEPTQKSGFFSRLFGQTKEAEAPTWISGLYCWGGVGRGKTFMMDLFMTYLPTTRKRRRHFHRFMLEINDALNRLEQVQNPMDTVVREMASEIDILCLDEFFVSDITHAMMLDRLLNAMKKYGVTIVTTSNIPPPDLYKNGLQRERFLPAIAWIEQNLSVHHIDEGEDFRKRHFNMANVFRTPDNAQARAAIREDLAELTGCEQAIDEPIFHAGSREIPLVWRNSDSIVFDFEVLCRGNYSQKDYIEIAKRFEYVAVVGVPVMDEYLEDAARRFLLLIDEFYDRRVKLLLTTAQAIEHIYTGKKMVFEFDRLQSRLFEMQSEAYWEEVHLP